MTTNQSAVTEFLLLEFSKDPTLRILHSVLFLTIYIIALVGNFLIIIVVVLTNRLHSPMYFFLVNLSILDICYISANVPKSVAISLTSNNVISFSGCIMQVFLIILCVGSEFSFLTVMAYDRYVAICHPLQYMVIMNWDVCIQIAAASWITNLIHAVLQTCLILKLCFCSSNTIGHFFCDIPHLHKISCTDVHIYQLELFAIALIVSTFCSAVIVASYGYVFSAVMRIPSIQGRRKALSTCTPHLTVFSLLFVTALFSAYRKPKSISSPTVDVVFAVLYAVLPPLLNPFIYSFRNKDIHAAVRKIPQKIKNLRA